MKFNWGHGLILFFIIYISYLVIIVVRSAGIDHALVDDNYYKLDLAYQNTYDQIRNGNERPQKVQLVLGKNRRMDINFGAHKGIANGVVRFYRPSNKFADKLYKFDLKQDSIYSISTSRMEPGRYIVLMSWHEGENPFMYKQDLFIEKL